MPQLRDYPQATSLQDTDAFLIDRIGSGSEYIEAADFAPRLTPGTYGDATHVAQITVDAGGSISDVANVAITYPADVSCITFIIDGAGAELTTGIAGDLEIPFACTITGATLLADQSGSVVVDIWKDTYANYPPTNADSITASAPPTIATAEKSQDTTLTGWTTSIAAGDTLRFNVDSVTTITRLTVALSVTKVIA
jgi:hypothetical protein